MYENHFSIKLISIENLYIMTTMPHIQKFKYDGIWYVKESDFDKLKSQWKESYDTLHDFDDKEFAKLKSIITDYENKITTYIDKIDEQEAIILTMTSEPVIECELETKKCKGLKCKGQSQPLELFMKNGKTLKNCKICRDYKCELDKKSRNKPRYIDMYELD